MNGLNAIAPPINHCRAGTFTKSGFYSWSLLLGSSCVWAIARRAVSTVIVPAVNTIAVHNRRPAPLLAAFFVALGGQVRRAIRTVSNLIGRRFAEFAGVPYQNPVDRQQWEELWTTEAEP
jgi:hypothetical protein